MSFTLKSVKASFAATLFILSGTTFAQNAVVQSSQEFTSAVSPEGKTVVMVRDKAAESTVKAQSCLPTFSGTVYGGPTSANTYNVAYGPFNTTCGGVISGNLINQSNAWLTAQLQHLSASGLWQPVETSAWINSSVAPGTYRIIVANTGQGSGTWIFNYNVPQ